MLPRASSRTVIRTAYALRIFTRLWTVSRTRMNYLAIRGWCRLPRSAIRRTTSTRIFRATLTRVSPRICRISTRICGVGSRTAIWMISRITGKCFLACARRCSRRRTALATVSCAGPSAISRPAFSNTRSSRLGVSRRRSSLRSGARKRPLRSVSVTDKPKLLIESLSEELLALFEKAPLLDPYDVYQHFMDYCAETLQDDLYSVSYTHLRAHETVLDLVCRLLLEKKK